MMQIGEGQARRLAPEWSHGKNVGNWIGICFAKLPNNTIRAVIAQLAAVCHAEFGLPRLKGNINR